MADLFINPETILSIARSWIGTPYRHQHSLKGVGADCLGFVRGVWQELYGQDSEEPPAYTRSWAELRSGFREPMLEGARRNMDEIPNAEDVLPGDVILIRVRPTALIKHCGIVTQVSNGRPTHLIHAQSLHSVAEDPIYRNWLGREMFYFRFRDLLQIRG